MYFDFFLRMSGYIGRLSTCALANIYLSNCTEQKLVQTGLRTVKETCLQCVPCFRSKGLTRITTIIDPLWLSNSHVVPTNRLFLTSSSPLHHRNNFRNPEVLFPPPSFHQMRLSHIRSNTLLGLIQQWVLDTLFRFTRENRTCSKSNMKCTSLAFKVLV